LRLRYDELCGSGHIRWQFSDYVSAFVQVHSANIQ
jgi:hypothetical protein